MDKETVTELAKRMCAAVMSYQLGMGMDSFYRCYLAGREEVAGIWYDVAELAYRVLWREMRTLEPP